MLNPIKLSVAIDEILFASNVLKKVCESVLHNRVVSFISQCRDIGKACKYSSRNRSNAVVIEHTMDKVVREKDIRFSHSTAPAYSVFRLLRPANTPFSMEVMKLLCRALCGDKSALLGKNKSSLVTYRSSSLVSPVNALIAKEVILFE